MTSLKCPVCGTCVGHDHAAFRGLAINTIASLGANLITNRELVATLEKKRWSKMHRAQHDRDMATVLNLQARIVEDERLLAELKVTLEGALGYQTEVPSFHG